MESTAGRNPKALSWKWENKVEALLKSTDASFAPENLFKHLPELHLSSLVGKIAYLCHPTQLPRESLVYWPVEILSVAGYWIQVQFLGYSPEDGSILDLVPFWLLFTKLKGRQDVPDAFELVPPRELPIGNGLQVIMERVSTLLRVKTIVQNFPTDVNVRRPVAFNIGDKIEARDKHWVNFYRLGNVDHIIGGRLEIGFYASSSKAKIDSYFCHPEWDHLHPLGWAKATGANMVTQATKYGKPKIVTAKGQPDLRKESQKKIGQVFEMVDPMRMNEFVVGQVTQVFEGGYIKCKIISDMRPDDLQDSCKSKNEFIYKLDSPYIFRCGTVTSSMKPFRPPSDAKLPFFWTNYFAQQGKSPLNLPEREAVHTEDHVGLERGMLLECMDFMAPNEVVSALVLETLPPFLVKIRFLGWSAEYDQWRPMNDKTMFPAGYSEVMGFPISGPTNPASPSPTHLPEGTTTNQTQRRPNDNPSHRSQSTVSTDESENMPPGNEGITADNGQETKSVPPKKRQRQSRKRRGPSEKKSKLTAAADQQQESDSLSPPAEPANLPSVSTPENTVQRTPTSNSPIFFVRHNGQETTLLTSITPPAPAHPEPSVAIEVEVTADSDATTLVSTSSDSNEGKMECA